MPGKVLKHVAGQPVLWHVIHRLRQCREVDDIVIATSTSPGDAPLTLFARDHDVLLTRGPEANVLERYLQAIEEHQADYIVRVTGDAPLVDPHLIDTMLTAMKREQADICHGHLDGGQPGDKVIHEGFTTISVRALKQLAHNGGMDPAVREHVTVKIDTYVPDLKIANISLDTRHIFNDARISVDTPSDLIFMNTLYEHLGVAAGEANITDVVKLLHAHPELTAINTHVHQKSADEVSHQVLIRCDGGAEIGLGHVMRCLSLAEHLRDRFATGVRFVIKASSNPNDTAAQDLLEHHMFTPFVMDSDKEEEEFLNAVLSKSTYHGVIFDIRTTLPATYLKSLRDAGLVCVCIDDPSDRRLQCDLCFYPPVPQVKAMSWAGFDGTLHCGWDWILLNPSFTRTQADVDHSPTAIMQILVCMGGADPNGMVFTALDALARVTAPFHVHIVLGQSFQYEDRVKSILAAAPFDATVHSHVQDMAALMRRMDLAIASFGVTAYELAASAVPAVLMGLTPDHVQASEALVKAGAALSGGLHSDTDGASLAPLIETLMNDKDKRVAMSIAAKNLNLNNGALNIAREIKSALTRKVQHP